MRITITMLLAVLLTEMPSGRTDEVLRIGTFEVDASPPVGSPLAYDPTKGTTTPLSSRGIVILGKGKPIVLCAVDWIGIANASHFEFRERLATAAGTTVNRVTVHALHQHDAPRCDFSAEAVLAEFGHAEKYYDERFCRSVFVRTADAVAECTADAKKVSEIATGQADVQDVASNRRILGEDGKVKLTRYTACRDPKVRAMPVGTIDSKLKLISLRSNGKVVANLSFYATHPQSYYRTGQANPDFPGLARNAFQKESGANAVHFNGAGGNIGAGKWNDGSKENRQVLATKVLKGMQDAAATLSYKPVSADDIAWKTESVSLPMGKHLVKEPLLAILKNKDSTAPELRTAAKHLAWMRQVEAGQKVDIGCLAIGPAKILFMPGELFVEYQLAAQKMAPESFVAMAAYGEYGAGYICTKIAYSQGGYESSERASRVSPEVEDVLMSAMKKLLHD